MTTPQNYFLDRSLPFAYIPTGDDYLTSFRLAVTHPNKVSITAGYCKIRKLKHCIMCGRLTAYVFRLKITDKWSWRICFMCMLPEERRMVENKYGC